MNGGTLLEISLPPGLPTFASRGLTQTLDPIEASSALLRMANGDLVDFSAPQLRKYKSTISCTDLEGPALDGIWPGMVLTVNCVAELGFLTISGSPTRPVVPDSSRLVGDYTFYRPQIVFLVVAYTVSTDEYGAAVAWTLELSEI